MEKYNDNPVFKALCKAFGVTENDLKLYEEEMKKANTLKMSEPEPKPVPEDPGKNDPEEYMEEEMECIDPDKYEDYEVADDEHVAIISKDDVEAILKEWMRIEDEVYKLDNEFGICLWNSDKETVYNRYNKMIRLFLEISFGVEVADVLEDWVFGYDDSDRPSFDSVWENIVKCKD